MARMVVIADDLTGAADCAASSAARGYSTSVLLYSPQDQQFESWADCDILSIDADTRCFSSEQASEITTRIVHSCELKNVDSPGYVLFKKIDSTLRGNVGAEIAAMLHARRTNAPAGTKPSLLMAPALPAQGRTTLAGRVLVHGVPLEKTDIWSIETHNAQSDILDLLRGAGLSCALIDIHGLRSDSSSLRQAISKAAKQADVVVCDAETDDDLRAIAEASLCEPAFSAFVGSAGLASQLPCLIGVAPDSPSHERSFTSGPALFVVGSAASVSRQQAHILESIPEISTFHLTPTALHDHSSMHDQIMQSLHSNRDVLLIFEGGEHCFDLNRREELPNALSYLVANCAPFLGALVATGGETARAALDALAIRQLRVLGEVEPGLPFSVAHHWKRPLTVITKAGAFGSPQALIHCRDFLRNLPRAPFRSYEYDPFLHHKS